MELKLARKVVKISNMSVRAGMTSFGMRFYSQIIGKKEILS
jgi:hypothetical protein